MLMVRLVMVLTGAGRATFTFVQCIKSPIHGITANSKTDVNNTPIL